MVNETLCSSALQRVVEIWSWLAFQLVFVHTAFCTREINWYGETVILGATCCACDAAPDRRCCASARGEPSAWLWIVVLQFDVPRPTEGEADLPCGYRMAKV